MYRGSYRKPYKVNRKFAKKVAISQGHTFVYTDLQNGSIDSVESRCNWFNWEIGSPTQTSQLYDAIQDNAAGYGIADYNTTFNTPGQWKMHVKILEMQRKLTFIGQTNNKLHIEFYELNPKRDLHKNITISSYEPVNLLSFGKAENLLLSGGAAMSYTDPRFTPFDCPLLTQNWNISKVRKFTVHSGGLFTANISSNNKTFSPGVDSLDIFPNLQYKKGKSKVLLCKIYGELAIVQQGTPLVGYVRYGMGLAAYKMEDRWKAHISDEIRNIYNDNHLAQNNTIGGVVTTVLEETEAFVNVTNNLEPSTV